MDARCERSPGKPTNYPMTNDSSHPGGYGGIEHSLVSVASFQRHWVQP